MKFPQDITFEFLFLALIFSLIFGTLGYKYIADLSWEDAMLNASMILGGQGQISNIRGVKAKIFASIYAIYCGVFFLLIFSIILDKIVFANIKMKP
jgi:hypothetical protein